MKDSKESTVYIGGTFDLFHIGHVNLLREAKAIFKKVVVSLNTDEFNFRYKRSYPIFPLQSRIEILKACRFVDEVVVNIGDEDSTKTILEVKPDFILHGDDYTEWDLAKQMSLSLEFMVENNIRFYFLPYTKKISTRRIRNRIRSHDSTECFLVVADPLNQVAVKNLISSLDDTDYKVVVVVNKSAEIPEDFDDYLGNLDQTVFEILFNDKDGYELGALELALNKTTYSAFVLLQSSIEITDLRKLETIFDEQYRNRSVCISTGLTSYLGKYQRRVLERVEIPIILNKHGAVTQEGEFNKKYLDADANKVDFVELLPVTSDRFVNKFGRQNMFIENTFISKYKGCWDSSMIKD